LRIREKNILLIIKGPFSISIEQFTQISLRAHPAAAAAALFTHALLATSDVSLMYDHHLSFPLLHGL
jgi:hypothetical protein